MVIDGNDYWIIQVFEPDSEICERVAPIWENTCNLGIDIPTREELIYNSFNSEKKLSDYLEVDTLKYLSVESLKSIFTNKGMCMGCINDDYNKNKNLEW